MSTKIRHSLSSIASEFEDIHKKTENFDKCTRLVKKINHKMLNYLHINLCTILVFKDGAYYCYCAYVLRISRYSCFLSVVLTNTGIFLRGLKLYGEIRT